jgi:two-component system, NarL family, response regulator
MDSDRAARMTENGTEKIRILVADDHAVVRGGVVAILGQQPDMTVVGEAADGQTALVLYAEHRPDVTMVDLRMPGLDGVGVIERIRALNAEARIVILTTYDTDDDIERGLRAGARAYLLKDVTPEELAACVRDVHAGRTRVAPAVAARLAERLGQVRLSTRELEVLRLLADARSNKEIASALDITIGTVKTHVNALFAKLGVGSRTEAMKVALQRGLIRSPSN